MSKKILLIAFLSWSVLLQFSGMSMSQCIEPAAETLKVKTVKGLSLTQNDRILDWLAVSDKSSVLFTTELIGDYNDYEAKQNILSIAMTSRGKVKGVEQILQRAGRVERAKAVWVAADDVGSPKESGGYGLLFALFYDDYEYSPWGLPVKLAVVTFDAAGRQTGPWRKLFLLTFDSESRIESSSLWVVKGKDSVAVALMYSTHTSTTYFSGVMETEILFFETNFEGKRLPDTARLRLPNSGKYQRAIVFKPVLYKSRWLIPVSHILGKRVQPWPFSDIFNVKMTASEAAVHTVKRTKTLAYRVGVTKFARVTYEDEDEGYFYMSLVPNSGAEASPRAKIPPFNLLVQYVSPIPPAQQDLEVVRFTYMIYPVNDKGRSAGSSRALLLPAVQHVITKEGGFSPGFNLELIFEMVPPSLSLGQAVIPAGEDSLYVCRIAMLLLVKGNDFRSETQIQLYSANLNTGSVQLLAENTNIPVVMLTYAIANWFKGKIGIFLAGGVLINSSPELKLMYTRYTP